MPDQHAHIDFDEGFRITRTSCRLRIEATDYHTRPLELGREELGKLGLMLLEDLGMVEAGPVSKAGPTLAERIIRRITGRLHA
jgi:hypothetical protein